MAASRRSLISLGILGFLFLSICLWHVERPSQGASDILDILTSLVLGTGPRTVDTVLPPALANDSTSEVQEKVRSHSHLDVDVPSIKNLPEAASTLGTVAVSDPIREGLNSHADSKNSFNMTLAKLVLDPKTCTTWNGRPAATAYHCSDYMAQLKNGCGDVCDISDRGEPSKNFNFVRKHIDCKSLMLNDKADGPAPVPRIKKFLRVPPKLRDAFLMGGLAVCRGWKCVGLGRLRRLRSASGSKSVKRRLGPYGEWTSAFINKEMAKVEAGKAMGGYGVRATRIAYETFKYHRKKIEGKHLFVIGSQYPWIEAMLLLCGARHITTIEYGQLSSTDPRITVLKPWELNRLFLDSGGAEPKFDGGATFSSVEHAGLNRYGDALNPWGDLVAMAKAWCITKPNGHMFAAVPNHHTEDSVHFSAHRVYSKWRWPQLMANWQQVDNHDQSKMDQPLHAFVRDEGKLADGSVR